MTLNPKELRLGNWVSAYMFLSIPGSHHGQSEIRKVQVDIGLLSQIVREPLSTYNPIPLTPEVLIACGATYVIANYPFYMIDKLKLMKLPNRGICYRWHWNVIQIESLHQLQNLFFDLTGTEITYNPE